MPHAILAASPGWNGTHGPCNGACLDRHWQCVYSRRFSCLSIIPSMCPSTTSVFDAQEHWSSCPKFENLHGRECLCFTYLNCRRITRGTPQILATISLRSLEFLRKRTTQHFIPMIQSR